MCELLGMSANVPTDICFSFSGLMSRGGKTGPHTDGWGITFYEGKGCRSFRDPDPSANSKIAHFVRSYPIKSKVIISHIRKANRGRICLENTQPFVRELWGQNWTFAHNGQLRGIKKYPLRFYQPIGTTDSEHACCWILDQIREKYPLKTTINKEFALFIKNLCLEMKKLGVANFLLTDSQMIFAFCSTTLYWITRKAPFGQAQLLDEDMTIDFSQKTTPRDQVTIIATQALTKNEQWNKIEIATMVVFHEGKVKFQL